MKKGKKRKKKESKYEEDVKKLLKIDKLIFDKKRSTRSFREKQKELEKSKPYLFKDSSKKK